MSVHLTFRSPAGERTERLESALTVGRDEACDVHIDSLRLSRRHAEFRLTPDGVVVRDLGSRNGIMLNGTRVDGVKVEPGTRVLLGDVAVTVDYGRGTATQTGQAPRPQVPPVPVELDATLIRPTTPSRTDPVPATPVQPLAADIDKTSILPRGQTLPAPRLDLPVQATTSASAPAPEPAPAASAHSTHAVTGRFSFNLRLTAIAVGVTVALSLLVATPLLLVAGQQVAAEATAHVLTLVDQVVIENRVALTTGQSLAITVRATAAEPGVRGVLVLSPDGRVLAPPDRLDETVRALEGFGDVTAISGQETRRVGNRYEAVGTITVEGRRAATVWVSYDPQYARGGQSATPFFVAFDLLLAVGAGLALAWALRRMVVSRLDALALDVDLAAAGRLSALQPRYDLPGLDRPIESLNYLIAQGRASMTAAAAPSSTPAAAPGAAAAVAPRPAMATPATLVLDGAFIVRRADGDAARILGADPSTLVGRHVLEVTRQQPLLDAIVDCLSVLGDGPMATRTLTTPVSGVVSVSVDRTGTDGAGVLTLHVSAP